MMLRIDCPWCGHSKMHYGEAAELRDEMREDVFSCRGCGSAYDEEEIRESVKDDPLSLMEVERVLKEHERAKS